MDNHWSETLVMSSDFPHFGDHGEDNVDVVGNSVVRPAGVLELCDDSSIILTVPLNLQSSLHTVIGKPVFFLLKIIP